MGGNTCDGDVYTHNLATFIKSHERQLANALIAYKKTNTRSTSKTASQQQPQQSTKPVRLSLSLHHLYFLLGKFQELGITVGPMNIRLDNIDTESSNNYVSFLSEFQRNKALASSDNQSIHSMSSVKSVMSSVSALWNTLGSSGNKGENIISDLKYLYSAFTKLPCLRIANDPNAKLIEGHEEYPFDTSTPIKVFKNLSVLEISELDPKEIYGWHILSENIRFLVIKKTSITDPVEVLVDLVNDDANRRGSMYSEESAPSPTSASASVSGSVSTAISSKRGSFSSPPLPSNNLFSNSYGSSPYYHYLSSSIPDSTSPPSSYHSSRIHHEEKQTSRRQYNYYQQQRRSQRSDSIISESRFPPASSNSDLLLSSAGLLAPPPVGSSASSATSNTTSIVQPFNPQPMTQIQRESSVSSQEELMNDHWKGLKHLSFTENKISSISDWSFNNLDNLSSLDLSYNKLVEVPGAALAKLNNLKSLNLSYNKLFSTNNFPKTLNKLAILNLRGNAISSLDSLENLKALEKIDLRQNRLVSISDLKPLLLINDEKVRLTTIYLVGNPIASNRGYRVELFNLFNGVDYSNDIRIDGSRPGIFESRLLLDVKGAQLKLNKFLDASIISKMTASVSNMNLSKVITTTTTTTTTRTTSSSTTTSAVASPTAVQNPRLSNNLTDEIPNTSSRESSRRPVSETPTIQQAHVQPELQASAPPLSKRVESALGPEPPLQQQQVPPQSELTTNGTNPKSLIHSPNTHTSNPQSNQQFQQQQILMPNKNVVNTEKGEPLALPPKPFSTQGQRKPSLVQSPTLSNFMDHISNPAPAVTGIPTNATASVKVKPTVALSSTSTSASPVAPLLAKSSMQGSEVVPRAAAATSLQGQQVRQYSTSSISGPSDTQIPTQLATSLFDSNIPPSAAMIEKHASTASLNTSISSKRASQENANPINRISIAAPALPVITQATTITTTVTSDPSSQLSHKKSAEDMDYFQHTNQSVTVTTPQQGHTPLKHPHQLHKVQLSQSSGKSNDREEIENTNNPNDGINIDPAILYMIKNSREEEELRLQRIQQHAKPDLLNLSHVDHPTVRKKDLLADLSYEMPIQQSVKRRDSNPDLLQQPTKPAGNSTDSSEGKNGGTGLSQGLKIFVV